LLEHILKDLLGPEVSNVRILLNSLGCANCRPKYRQALKDFLVSIKESLCADCQRRMEKNPLRVLDCKEDNDKLANAPVPEKFWCKDCRAHFEQVKRLLDSVECACRFAPRLVRGLDYYTGTVFEAVTSKSGSQNALAAGGRYDGLVSDLGGPATPAVGFAIGLDRVAEMREALNLGDIIHYSIPAGSEKPIFIAVLGEKAVEEGFRLLKKLRHKQFLCHGLLPDKSLKAQMRYAGSCGSGWVVILGDNELSRQVAMVKDLTTGSQSEVALGQLTETLKRFVDGETTRV